MTFLHKLERSMMRLIIAMSLLFFHNAFAADMQQRNILMFIGNPGVGKSTVINSLKQEKVASSGVKLGSGMTQFFAEFKHSFEGKDFLLFDTPGLEDVKLRNQAADEIEKALKQDGVYKLFFVITLEAGRIKPADLATIDVVMDAIDHNDRAFNVIINKLSKKEKAALEISQARTEFLNQLNSGKWKTDSVFYIDNNHELADGGIEFFTPTKEFASFIYEDSEAIAINKQQVTKLEIDKFDQMQKAHEEEMAKIRAELEVAKRQTAPVYYVTNNYSDDDGICVVQ